MKRKVRLFCLPYAGGSTAIYNRWKRQVTNGNTIELVPIELTGRGARIGESLYDNYEEALEDLYPLIANSIEEEPFAFFGYSMGCVIAFELAHRIWAKTGYMAKHMFFAARKPPHLPTAPQNWLHTLPPFEFEKAIIKLGGITPDFFQNRELAELFLPVLRSDLKLAETYQFVPKTQQLTCDFSILGGTQDNISINELMEWGKQTAGNSNIQMFQGGHFFIHSQSAAILEHIQQVLLNYEVKLV